MGRMHWDRITEKTGVFTTRFALIPAYRVSERELVLIDSGAQAHPELLAELDSQGLRVAAVICTHLHPDHIANNRALRDRYGTEIFATPEELREVAPRYALLRADPLEEKWLWTEPDYPITPLAGSGVRELPVCAARFTILPTPGHVEGHIAVVTPDGICCLGDAMMSVRQLETAQLPYMEYDVDQAVETMSMLGRTHYAGYCVAHRGVIPPEELPALIRANIQKELALYDLLRRLLTAPMELEEAVTAFMRAAGVVREVALRRSTMRHSAQTRIAALVRSGELRLDHGRVFPAAAQDHP